MTATPLAISDPVAIAVIVALSTAFTGALAYFERRRESREKARERSRQAAEVKAAELVEEVRTKLEETTQEQKDSTQVIVKQLDKVETLVNSKLGVPLRALAVMLEKEAIRTGDPADRAAADAAKAEADNHDVQQKKVDAKAENLSRGKQ